MLSFQAFPQASNQYAVSYINDRFNFFEKRILAIERDELGYVWFATPNGINRFDGQDVKIYKNGFAANSLSSNSVMSLDVDGNFLWIGYENGFVDRLNIRTGAVELIGKFSDKAISKIYNDSLATWIGTSNLLICRNKINTDTFQISLSFKPPHDRGKVSYSDDNYVNGIYDNGSGKLWLATLNGLFSVAKSTREREYHTMNFVNPVWRDNVFHDLMADRNGNLWLGTWGGGLVFYDVKMHNWKIFKNDKQNLYSSTNNIILDVELKNENEIWIATLTDGLGIYNVIKDTFTFPWSSKKPDPLKPSTLVTRLHCDYGRGMVWVGSEFGVHSVHFDQGLFKRFYLPVSKSSNGDYYDVREVVEDKERNIKLVATGYADGLNIIDNATGIKVHYNIPTPRGDESEVINDLLLEGRDSMWVVTRYYLCLFDLRTRRWLPFKQPLTSQLRTPTLFKKILKDRNNHYWFSSDNGLFKYSPKDNSFIHFKENGPPAMSLRSDLTWDMDEDNDGNVWITSKDKGFDIYLIKENKFLNDSSINSFLDKFHITNVYGITIDGRGNIWMASNAGVVKLQRTNNGKFTQTIYFDNELLSSPAFDIEMDSEGKLWVISSVGLFRFDPDRPQSASRYNAYEGFDYPLYENVTLSVDNGKLFINVHQGWYEINTKELRTDISEKRVRVDQFKVFDEVKLLEDSGGRLDATLSFEENFFSFEYSTVSYNNPSNVKYAYKLEGFDEDWINVKRTSSYYTDVPPGNYVFRVRTTNMDGSWSKKEATVNLHITPPFWKTSFFRIATAMIMASFIILVFKFRERYLVEDRSRLEKVVQQRTLQIEKQSEEIQAKNHEITSQNEELFAQAETLVTQNDTLKKQSEELIGIKSSLEDMVLDRTKRLEQLNEELIDQNVKLEQFTFITAHNLRAPIAQLKGLIMLLERGDDTLTYSDAMPLIKRSAFWLDEVINDLNHILQIRKNSRNTEVVDLKEQLMLAINALDTEIDTIGASVDYSRFRDAQISGVKAYVQSIFYNLIHNALKYSQKNAQTIIIIANVVVDSEVVIKVMDNGIGIDMHYAREKIFRLYQRFSTSYQGKGYGLFLVKTQVESMGGSIGVESELAKGTMFTIKLPLGVPEEVVKVDNVN
jgi:signal transduction histidine kinase/ligand-binding sensor domain-containing protein